MSAMSRSPCVVHRVGPPSCRGVAAHPFAPAAAAKNYWNDGLENAINSGWPADQQRNPIASLTKTAPWRQFA